MTCSDVGSDGVSDAPHYGIEFTVTYTNDPVQVFDFSVKGDPAPTTFEILLSDLNSINGESPTDVDVEVKALHPGKLQGRQNSATSTADCGVT